MADTVMEKITRVCGIAAPFPEANINTDAILPVRWMRLPTVELGQGLFGNLRYHADGSENREFLLNREPYRATRILLGGPNFGCGSSREAAVWALRSFGIDSIIAPSFGEIFHENAFRNRLLLIVLPLETVMAIAHGLADADVPSLTIDLEACHIQSPMGRQPFSYPAQRRAALLEGLDEVDATLRYLAEIRTFRDQHRRDHPWIYHRPARQ
jgi:3-isopropylmalate/(R)-2-methylmalate dehydratase small subunit